MLSLQQCLPLAVLKLVIRALMLAQALLVATVLTACGIETAENSATAYKVSKVATVLTACGIETSQ